jgi:hypothetical protein
MRRNVMKLLMLPALALCTTLVACEQAGDLTGPSQVAPSSMNANLVELGPLQPGVVVEPQPDSLGLEIEVLQGASGYAVIIPE